MSFPEGRRSFNASQGQCPKRRTTLPFSCASQYSPLLKPSRMKLVVFESLSDSSRESALFSPHFFADADSSARGDWAVLLFRSGINIPFKFLAGNLASLEDRPPPAGETGSAGESPLRPCARCRRPKFNLCRVTPLICTSPWEG